MASRMSAKDPKRIPKVLNEIKKVWRKHPELRLMQMIGNCYEGFDADPYYQEDEEFVYRLHSTYKETTK